jgi:hypothetical protein
VPQLVKVVLGSGEIVSVVREAVVNYPNLFGGNIIMVDGVLPKQPDPLAFAAQSLVSTAFSTAIALPASVILVSAIKGDASTTTRWRRVAFFVDAAFAAAAIGAGIFESIYWSRPENNPKRNSEIAGYEGALYFIVSVPFGGAAALDLIPYSFERK